MAGTKEGGSAAAKTNKAKYGSDFYARIGAMGGKKGTTGGFASQSLHTCGLIAGAHRIALCAGTLGGRKSRRAKKAN